MDVLYLREAEIERLLTMEVALEAVESTFRAQATGRVVNHPRQRLHPDRSVYFHYMAAADMSSAYFGMKLYTSAPAGVRFLVPLYRADSGALLAPLEADFLGRMRTGAASGGAAKEMARGGAAPAGILGGGPHGRRGPWPGGAAPPASASTAPTPSAGAPSPKRWLPLSGCRSSRWKPG